MWIMKNCKRMKKAGGENGISVYTHVKHEFEPVFDEESRILILGTLPSVKSREQQFYYGHKQNRGGVLEGSGCDLR